MYCTLLRTLGFFSMLVLYYYLRICATHCFSKPRFVVYGVQYGTVLKKTEEIYRIKNATKNNNKQQEAYCYRVITFWLSTKLSTTRLLSWLINARSASISCSFYVKKTLALTGRDNNIFQAFWFWGVIKHQYIHRHIRVKPNRNKINQKQTSQSSTRGCH